MRHGFTFNDANARVAIDAIRDELVGGGKSAVIAVAGAHRATLALPRMSGTISRNARHSKTGFDISYYGDRRYVGFMGGVHVVVDGAIAGADRDISGDEDEELAVFGIAAVEAVARASKSS